MKNGNGKSATNRHNGNDRERDDNGRFESDNDYSRNRRDSGDYRNSDTDFVNDDQYERSTRRSDTQRDDWDRNSESDRNRNYYPEQSSNRMDRSPGYERNSDGGSYSSYGNGPSGYANGNFGTRRNLERREDDNGSERSRSDNRTDGSSGLATHRGKGPKGYKRSDDRIQEDVNDRLSDDHQLDATNIEVTVEAGEVKLSGTVTDRRDKRRAEDIAESVSGISNVQNNIRISKTESGNAAEGKPKTNGKHA